jgi:hypothetical protein
MKITSIQFVFDNGAVVTFIRGSKEIYTGNQVKFQGKHYYYTVRIENKNGMFETATFASPSQDQAKTFLTNSLKTAEV